LAPDRHAFLFVMHHLISDGWSLSVLAHELTALYGAFRRGEPNPLPPPRLQYRDYAAWHNRQVEDAAIVPHRRYWAQKLAGPLPILELPTDLPRPPRQSSRGELFTFTLDAELYTGLQQLATAQRATLFMVLAALVKVLLHRYTGQEEILIGTPISGRTHPDLDRQIGFYLNTLALRDAVTPHLPFAEFLGRVRQTALEAYEHELYPFDKLIDDLGLQRDLSRSPVFDVMVILQNAGSLNLNLEGVRARPFAVEPGTSKYDLTFDFAVVADGLQAGIRYNTDLLRRDRIERMSRHLLELARSLLRDAGQPVGKLKMLPDAERELLLRDFNRTAAALPSASALPTLVELFEEQVRKSPDAQALSFEEQALTYQELDRAADRLADQLAHHLRGALNCEGGAEVLVGLFVERSPEMVVGLLGILKAGCAYVPLDPAYPPSRLTYMLQDSRAAVILTQQRLWPRLSEILAPLAIKPMVICLDGEEDQLPTVGRRPAGSLARREGLAYVLYTSGSTGRPKGVAVTHDALLNFLCSMRKSPGISATDVLLAVTTISFDIAGLELYLPLISGARIALASTRMGADGLLLAERLGRGDITIMQATPGTWRLLLAAGWEGSPQLTVLCGGEALPGNLASALTTGCRSLWNLYGPTETTIWSTLHRVGGEPGEPRESSPIVSIGRPIDNTQIYILDSLRQPVPVGVPGELYIGGSGLARGYWNRPELTAQKFVPDPFSSQPGGRLYRTGDLARFLPDGRLEFLGRTDHQVKLRGFRIETGEVESALLKAPAVRAAIVTVREDSQGEACLVAYLVAEQGELQPAELRAHLAGSLPDYMIPSVFIQLPAFPAAPNGKVDRAALPAPAAANRTRDPVAPRDGIEQSIARIWEEVLEVKPIGIHDDFFELGGHSLKATRIAFRIQRELQLKIALMDIFRQPTVAALAGLASQRDGLRQPVFKPRKDSGAIIPVTPEELEMLADD
ncbi:MAG TPA: amino acid adenylation domain-containing protein, partial [Blastocatellia bacterium]|nr:amino acid adenylation domain-containing protein [Blastocatellia bacterium]